MYRRLVLGLLLSCNIAMSFADDAVPVVSLREVHQQVSHLAFVTNQKNLVRLDSSQPLIQHELMSTSGRPIVSSELPSSELLEASHQVAAVLLDTVRQQTGIPVTDETTKLVSLGQAIPSSVDSSTAKSQSVILSPSLSTVNAKDLQEVPKLPQLPFVGTSSGGGGEAPLISEPNFIEAFDPEETRIDAVQNHFLTLEHPDPLPRGWLVAREDQDHWATLAWLDPSHQGRQSIPLISKSKNILPALDVRAAEQQEENRDQGFIFGKIARGWDIQVSAELQQSVFYVSTDLQRKSSYGSAESLDHEERYFLVLNLPAGTHLISVVSRESNTPITGAVMAPVLPRSATFLDMTQIAIHPFQGVIDADTDELALNFEDSGKVRSELTIQGQPLTRHEVLQSGEEQEPFRIEQVVTVGDYPFYVQIIKTTPNRHEIHQYRVFPWEMFQYTLYDVAVDKLEHWVRHIPGEFQADAVEMSGDLILAAVPKVIEQHPRETLSPKMVEFPRNHRPALLQPFTLSPVSSDDSPLEPLSGDGLLAPFQTRFLGVQVPKGMTLISVQQAEGRTVWSTLSMTLKSTDTMGQSADPKIVNILGPY